MGHVVLGLMASAREGIVAIPCGQYHDGRKPRRLGVPKRGPQPSLGLRMTLELSPEDGPKAGSGYGVGRGLMERAVYL